MRLSPIILSVITIAVAVGAAGHAGAVTFEVDSFLDEPDDNTGDGVCDSDPSAGVTRCVTSTTYTLAHFSMGRLR